MNDVETNFLSMYKRRAYIISIIHNGIPSLFFLSGNRQRAKDY